MIVDDEAVRARRDEPAPAVSEALAIDARNLHRSFGTVNALAGVSLRVPTGQIQAVLGRNGAGKTTLLRMLNGLVEPDAGTIRVLGADASRSTRWLRERIGFVPSGDRTFYLRLSGYENLLFFARLSGLSRRAAGERARDALAAVELSFAASRRVGEYSHGMQKRLSIARALLTRPSVLLVDEATHDLDPHASRLVHDLVRDIADTGTAVVWATQRIDDVRGFADDVVLLRDGRDIFSGSVARLASYALPSVHIVRLASDPDSAVSLARLRGAVGARARIERVADDEPQNLRLAVAEGVLLGDVLAALHQAGAEVASCREERSDLEEAFIALTATP
jgi:ABC-2 type transport system ATP-binding protein